MARPSVPVLLLAISVVVSGVLSDDGLPKWSQRSASSGGWVPLDAPCDTCRPPASDQETQASSGFASEAAPAPQPQVVFRDASELRPPPAPLRVQQQEGTPQRPAPELYITDQRPPPLPIPKPIGGKQGRDHRFFYNQNPTRHQLNFLPDNAGFNPQEGRVVFPIHPIASQIPQQSGNLQPGRQNLPFIGQSQENQSQRPPQPFLRHQQTQHLQQAQHQQHIKQQPQQLTQNPQLQHPHKQIKFQSVSHNQFPLLIPQNSLPTPHGFQSPQLHLLPVPHSPQPSIPQVDIQSALQQQIHHQINQQLLGSPFVAPLPQFPPSALGQQLQFPVRNPTLGPPNLQLLPQQQASSPPIKPPQTVNQQLELTPAPKPNNQPVPTTQADSPNVSKDSLKNNFQTNPEEEVQEEVQLLYVPVEALRQRGRVHKEVVQSQSQGQHEKLLPDRQAAHSFQIKHYQERRPSVQSTEQFKENKGTSQVGINNSNVRYNQEESGKVNKEQFDVQNVRSAQGQPTVVREENQRFTFSPPVPQSFHENIQLQGQRQATYQETQTLKQIPDNNYRIQTLENLQQEEQQRAVNQQQVQHQRQPQRERQQFYRKPSRVQEENSQSIYQNNERQVSQSIPTDTTSRPTTALPNPTFSTTQGYSSTSPAPYQPPLSVYMEDFVGQGSNHLTVDDVLKHLNGADTVPVLEQAGSHPPKVFVGPSALHPPKGYAKFELPYLSMLDTNRVERKVDRLPFFVAPLSFQPPPGYAKIPFPAPHVGSVVVSSTPVQSTTESTSLVSQTTASSGLSHQVNSLQASNSSPGNVELVPNSDDDSGSITLTSQQPPVHHTSPKQLQRHQIHRQQQSPVEIPQQQLHRHQFNQQRLHPQQLQQQQFQQQQFQQDQQQHLLQQQFPPQQIIQQQFPQQLYSQQQALQQDIPQHHVTQQQHDQERFEQQTSPQQPSYLLYTTPSPSSNPLYFSSSIPPSTSSTTTTTTTTTTTVPPPPEVKAPVPQRGRNRHRQSYSQTNSPDVDYNYRNRGSYRSSNSDTTRQPSVRTRRPWDGRRRPSTTTTEQSAPSEGSSYENFEHQLNPVSPSNQVLQSTVRNSEQIQDIYNNDNIKEVSPPTIEQQYSKDDPYTQSTIIDGSSKDGPLRTQGAFVLTAFQHPQVLGDVINGQIQRPENTNSFKNYYDGNRQNFGSTFEASHNDQSNVNIRTQSSVNEKIIPSHFESPEITFTQNNEQKKLFQNEDVAHSKVINGGGNDVPAKSSRLHGHQRVPQQRAQESPSTSTRQFYQDDIPPVTPGTVVESHYPTSDEQQIHNNGGIFRNYNQQTNSIQNPVQNVQTQQVFPTQFTPSIQISEVPSNEESTQLPKISNSPVSHQPQIFIISTPIPHPAQGRNRTYISQQNFNIPQDTYQPPDHSTLPIADIVNQGLKTNIGQQLENSGQNYHFGNDQEGGIVEEAVPQVPHRFQSTTTEQAVIDVQTEGEPKRTKLRQPQRTFNGLPLHRSPEGSETIDEERPRYRQQQFRNSGDTRTRQPSQRTRSRYHTTESPIDEESGYSPPQRNQRYRGRQRVVPTQNVQENSQYSENQAKLLASQNIPTEVSHTTLSPVTEKELISRPQDQQLTYEVGSDGLDSYRTQYTEGQPRSPEIPQVPQTHLSQEKPVEAERPSNVRSRVRFRNPGERIGTRQRGQIASYNNQEISSNVNSQNRNQEQGQRFQQIPRHHIFQEAPYQEASKPTDDNSQHLVLSFDGTQQKAQNYPKPEDEGVNPSNPIHQGLTAEIVNLNPIQGPGNDAQPIISQNAYPDAEQYKQPSSNEDQESLTHLLVSTEATTPAKPGRKYVNFVSRGLPRRPSHTTSLINPLSSTTSSPETTTSHKVYTVRPTRRPATKAPVTTRARIRRPTTPTTTTTTTTESPYFLTTAAPTVTQGDIPPYDQSATFGGTRGNFRARKRPVAVSRRPKPSTNEVQQEEQEDETSRLQGSYRQRIRGSSRRVSTQPPEPPIAQWRQPEEEQSGSAQIRGPAEGFTSIKNKVNDDSYVTSQHNVEPSNFQISLPEEQLPAQIPTRTSDNQGKIKNINQLPVYQHDEYYYPQNSQQQQEVQEPRLNYQSPPVRPTSFVAQDDADYSYEQSSQPSYQATQQKSHVNKESTRISDNVRQKGNYDNQPQDFVINFSGLSTAADTSFVQRDELDSGEETRYFDNLASIPSKSQGKISKYTETKIVPLEEISESVESASISETSDESEKLQVSSEPPSESADHHESSSSESKETSVESEDKGDGQPIKKLPGRRRGNWVRVRTKGQRRRPGDMLETAESQNLATVSQNLLQFNQPLKGKTESTSTWVDTPSTEESAEEKTEEPVPVEEVDNVEAFDITIPDVFEDAEGINFNQEENEETKDEPGEEIQEEALNDDESLVVKEIFDDNDELKDSQAIEIQDSSADPLQLVELTVTSNKTLQEESDKAEMIDDENEISENFEHKTTVSESSTKPINNDSNESDDEIEYTTEDSTSITTEMPTPRVLGTSTTTEISLETEICYRGRCVKTKVDADQVPIE